MVYKKDISRERIYILCTQSSKHLPAQKKRSLSSRVVRLSLEKIESISIFSY